MKSRFSPAKWMLVTAILVGGPGVGTAGAAVEPRAASFYTPQALKAEGLRWQGLAEHYARLAKRPAASFFTPTQLRVEGLRWQKMAQAYDRGSASPAVSSSSPSRFDWADAGIGAVGGIGLGAFALSLVLGARRLRRVSLAQH